MAFGRDPHSSTASQRRGSPNMTLQTRSSEAPWIRDQRRTPRSARGIHNSNNTTHWDPHRQREPYPDTKSAEQESPRRDSNDGNNHSNPFDSPDISRMQPQPSNNRNPFDSPSPSGNTGSNFEGKRTDSRTVGTIKNPFESPTPSRPMFQATQQLQHQQNAINPFDSPYPSTRPPVSPKRKESTNTTTTTTTRLSPAKQESVALDSLEQILDTTDETTQENDEDELDALTDGTQQHQPQAQQNADQQQQRTRLPQHSQMYHNTATKEAKYAQSFRYAPVPFRTPTPSVGTPSPVETPTTTSSRWTPNNKTVLISKTSTQTPPTTTSSRSVASWVDVVDDQSSSPSDRAMRAAETLRRNFEHRKRQRQQLEKDGQQEGHEIVLKYSHNEASEYSTRGKDFAPAVVASNDPWMLQEFGEAESSATSDDTNVEATPSVEAPQLPTSPSDSSTTNYALHDLCDEAVGTDDLAWRNALYLLSVQPQLASQQEPQGRMTPLHVACLASEPPPLWMTRGLLYTAPSACRQTDNGGRLPLHLLVATSANVDTMRLLVEEYPPSVAHQDDRGFTPLQLLLKNDQVVLTLEHLRLLLGQLTHGTTESSSKQKQQRSKLSFRKGDHLKSSIEELESLAKEHQERHEMTFRQYPDDVRQCLTKLSQWKRRQDHKKEQEAKRMHQENLMLLRVKDKEFESPASIPTPSSHLLPLHSLVRRRVAASSRELFSVKEASREDLLRIMISAYPKGLVATDANGKTPLMTALLQAESLPSDEMVELLLGLRTPGFGFRNRERPALIPSGETGQLPLHVAAEEMLSNFSVLSTICEAYPEARAIQDFRGRTPLHLALQNYRSVPVSDATLALLYIDSIAQTKDDDGKTPFDVLVENPKCVIEPWLPFMGASHDSTVFQDFFDASMKRPQNGRETEEFLQQLRELPPWLRRQACAARSVQDTLIEEMASPFNTFRILVAGFVLVIMLILLRRLLHVNDDLGELIYYLAMYHLAMQGIFWAMTLHMGECLRLCIMNLWRWIDLTAGILCIWCVYEVDSTSVSVENQSMSSRNIGAAATAACWLSFLGYLVDWCCGVAVFFGSAVQLLLVLMWPLSIAAMGAVATSQILFTLEDCTEGEICSLTEAYTIVYRIILGEPILVHDYELSQNKRITILVCTVLWVWWIFSAVATTVAEAKQLDRKQIAVAWYWEPKIILTVTASGGSRNKIRDSPSIMERYCNATGTSWEALCDSLCSGQRDTSNWSVCCLRSKVSVLFTRCLAVFILPIWMALGLCTFGVLWPPQIRRWIFRPTTSSECMRFSCQKTDCTDGELTRAKLSQLRTDVVELKAVAYDQNYQIHKDLGYLKDIIFRAVMDDDDDHPKRE